jgi:hypothetical protein
MTDLERSVHRLDLPDGGSVIVYDWSQRPHPIENLICINSDGTIRWKGKLPDPTDFFVGADLAGDLLIASTWNGFAMSFDPQTGNVQNCVFAK